MEHTKRKLWIAMTCYGVLLLAALYLLLPVRSSNEAFILVVLLLVYALLAVKTMVHRDDES
jgi:hypothetical protein